MIVYNDSPLSIFKIYYFKAFGSLSNQMLSL